MRVLPWNLAFLLSSFALSAMAAPTPSRPRSSPAPRIVPRVPIGGRAELRIVGVGLARGQRLTPGAVASVIVDIENTSGVSARAVAAYSPDISRAAIVRGAPVSIGPHARVHATVRVPLDPRKIHREQFAAHMFVADPAKPVTGSFAQQVWGDRIRADDSRTLTLAVPVSIYDVTVTLRQITVNNDCNPGAGKSNWMFSWTFGSVSASEAGPQRSQGDVFHLRRSWRGVQNTLWWPSPGRYRTVSTGDRIRPNTRWQLPSVSKDRHLSVNLSGGFNNGILWDQHGALPRLSVTIPPRVWNYGGSGSYTANVTRMGSFRSFGNCGTGSYTMTFAFATVPTVIR